MKSLKIPLFALFLLLTSCEFLVECDPYDYPDPPYSDVEPNQTNIYESEFLNSITYVYYCYDGKRRSIEYSKSDPCDSWLRSDVISKCTK